MASPTREEILAWLTKNLSDGVPPPEQDTGGDLSRVELGLIFDGLSQALRPIRVAVSEITKEFDLGPRGAFILSLIDGGVVHPLDVAVALGIRPSSATAELRRLADAGLVQSRQDEIDRRKTVLSLTPDGQVASNRNFQAMTRVVLENLKGYSSSELRLFSRMLSDVRKGCSVIEE
ncbi:winged helix DNA-binding protein [Novosphingobium sp. G106]|uniref:MarR family winged helix-turn-helix transcriptional regulator n=1 Tax=Novosphingobium sp. G106 TaxID=2849500 RepID=UPI001C2D863B|nr:winged helix DNA-binding protein [Novosphingobium sp. G106]MBV1686251.1 winged helix DNA-binding protein [Novosphingobium sp. G106]